MGPQIMMLSRRLRKTIQKALIRRVLINKQNLKMLQIPLKQVLPQILRHPCMVKGM